MFSHVMVGANDLEASRKFYDAVLGTLGIAPGVINNGMRYFYRSPKGLFLHHQTHRRTTRNPCQWWNDWVSCRNTRTSTCVPCGRYRQWRNYLRRPSRPEKAHSVL
jgi:catechol 2,3-dioxygenase-like lactoylglutathione lyase family enzyme